MQGLRLLAQSCVTIALFCIATGQGTPFACCYADGRMYYGFCTASWPGVRSWSEFKACWSQASLHFANTTVVGEYNLTMAEKYNVFVIVIDDNTTKINAEFKDLPLSFDADTIPSGAQPELGYLPFELRVSFPLGGSSGACPHFELHDLAINITLHKQQQREPGRTYAGFTFGISGCGRQSQSVHGLTFHALGYGNLELNFLTLQDSSKIVSIEPPTDAAINGPAGDALAFQESDVINCTFHYFGDITGDIGNTYGLTQNGSRSIRNKFLVVDPQEHIPDYSYRTTGDGYRFSWFGSYPQEWKNLKTEFKHMDATDVQYIRDVQLGSINVSHCNFVPWLDRSNPIFANLGARATANPPSIELYNMEMASTYPMKPHTIKRHYSLWGHPRSHAANMSDPMPKFGCNASDSTFNYIWDIDILESAVSRSLFNWSAAQVRVPESWTGKVVNPSFWVDLQTYARDAAFARTINDTLACMRPSIKVNGTTLPAQSLTLANGSFVFRSQFLHTSDKLCTKSVLINSPKWMQSNPQAEQLII